MTEQDVKVLEVKLTRIWRVVAPFRVRADYYGSGSFDLRSLVSQDVELRVSTGFSGEPDYAQYALHEIGPNLAFLRCNTIEVPETLLGDYWTAPPEGIPQRQNEWMPLFRRNCWLCGCNIEANMHEKMEWIQGFSREELEAWNLKL